MPPLAMVNATDESSWSAPCVMSTTNSRVASAMSALLCTSCSFQASVQEGGHDERGAACYLHESIIAVEHHPKDQRRAGEPIEPVRAARWLAHFFLGSSAGLR
jgi:hypothetical protein